MWQRVAWIALAGAAGTVARYALSGLAQKLCGEKFPCGTLAVNAFGCFLFGVVWALGEERVVISGQMRFILLTGFMGAFTTFSTFAFETGEFLRDSDWMLATCNLAGQIVLGLVCLFLGFAASRLI